VSDPGISRPGIDRLLIASALDGDLRRRLLDTPDDIFPEFDLTDDEKEILRSPDRRLLPLLGAALARQPLFGAALAQPAATAPVPDMPVKQPQPHAVIEARTLPDISLALTLVPCAQYENGQIVKVVYAAWVNPLPEGVDPASLPPPAGAALPGVPLAPLHAVIQVSVVQTQGAIGLSAALLQSSNMSGPPPGPPVAGDLLSESVQTAIAGVRSASTQDRRARIVDLLRALRGGEAA
jgi:hypothetical protein